MRQQRVRRVVHVTEMSVSHYTLSDVRHVAVDFSCRFLLCTESSAIAAMFSLGNEVMFIGSSDEVVSVVVDVRDVKSVREYGEWHTTGHVAGAVVDVRDLHRREWTIWDDEFPKLNMWGQLQ